MTHGRWLIASAICALLVVPGCGKSSDANRLPTSPSSMSPVTTRGLTTGVVGPAPPVHVVLFTHIEDNTPAGVLGTTSARANYATIRARLLQMAALAERYGVSWSLQPDWKVLLAAQQYEDASLTSTTGGVNLLRYLRDHDHVAIDPHSHESNGYNYTDVASLLDALGVGGSTVIGGHIWDPSLPTFAEWDRFRVPVSGQRYPTARWRGDILMGSGTPNHVNDPIVSGVWRPRDRDHYFEDDPLGNIAAVGAYTGSVDGINELVNRYRTGVVDAGCLLTATYHLNPSRLTTEGLREIETSVLLPLLDLRSQGRVTITDFTSLIQTWRQRFGAQPCLINESH